MSSSSAFGVGTGNGTVKKRIKLTNPLQSGKDSMSYGHIKGLTKKVSRIVFGTLFLAKTEDPFALLDTVHQSGCNSFDSAACYAAGECEKILGKWIQARSVCRKDIVIATKGGAGGQDTLWAPDISRDHLVSELQGSLARLQTDYVDIYMLHRDDQSLPVSEIVDTMHDFVIGGFVTTWGVSNWSTPRLMAALEYAQTNGKAEPVCDSLQCSLAEPCQSVWPGTTFMTSEKEPWYSATGTSVLAWECLAKGFLAGSWGCDIRAEELAERTPTSTDDPTSPLWRQAQLEKAYLTVENLQRRDRVANLAIQRGATMGQVALAYLLAQPYDVFVLVGTTKTENWVSNARSTSLNLTKLEVEYLKTGADDSADDDTACG